MKKQVPVLMLLVVTFGTLNSFAGRIKAATLGRYSGVVSGVLDAIVYALFYVGLTAFKGEAVRKQVGRVLRVGKSWQTTGICKFLIIAGLSDQIGSIFGFVCQPYLTVLMYSLMNQAIVPFTVALSMLILRSRYIAVEVCSVCVVAAAALSCVLSSAHGHGNNDMDMAALTAVTTCFPAGAYVLKEMAFQNWSDTHEQEILAGREQPVNVFLVGAVTGVTGLFFSLPVALGIQSLQSASPVQALEEGFHVLLHADYALTAYIIYTIVNLAFNFALLTLVGNGSALLAFLSLKLTVPFVALLSPLPWPIIGPSPVTDAQWIALVLMLGGVVGFRYGNIRNYELSANELAEAEEYVCCWPLFGFTPPGKPSVEEPMLKTSALARFTAASLPAGSAARTQHIPIIPLKRSASAPAKYVRRRGLTCPLAERGLADILRAEPEEDIRMKLEFTLPEFRRVRSLSVNL